MVVRIGFVVLGNLVFRFHPFWMMIRRARATHFISNLVGWLQRGGGGDDGDGIGIGSVKRGPMTKSSSCRVSEHRTRLFVYRIGCMNIPTRCVHEFIRSLDFSAQISTNMYAVCTYHHRHLVFIVDAVAVAVVDAIASIIIAIVVVSCLHRIIRMLIFFIRNNFIKIASFLGRSVGWLNSGYIIAYSSNSYWFSSSSFL